MGEEKKWCHLLHAPSLGIEVLSNGQLTGHFAYQLLATATEAIKEDRGDKIW